MLSVFEIFALVVLILLGAIIFVADNPKAISESPWTPLRLFKRAEKVSWNDCLRVSYESRSATIFIVGFVGYQILASKIVPMYWAILVFPFAKISGYLLLRLDEEANCEPSEKK